MADVNKNRQLILKHTSIHITNYSMGDCPTLEGYFKLYDPMTHTQYFKALIYDEEKKELILPRGLDIYLLENLLGVTASIDYEYDEYDLVEPIMIKYLPRDDNQKLTLRFILGEGEYKHNQRKSQLCVNNNTGSGKTYVGSMMMAYNLYKTIVIASTTGILEQWVERMAEYTDISMKDICLIKGTPTINRLLQTEGNERYKVFLVTHSTLTSYGNTNGWDAVGELFKFLKVGLKIIDEYHQNFDNISYIDGYTNTYKTLYLSATPIRSDEKENRIYQYAFKNIPAIELFDEDKDPHTDYIAIRYNSRPKPSQISDCKNQYGLNRIKYIQYLVKQEEFELILYYVAKICKNTNGKVLIYIGVNSCIEYVRDWLVRNFPELRTKIGIYTSIVKEDKKSMLDKKIILSTTKSCGAAMDIKDLKTTILLAEPFKSEVLARQSLGRTRDPNTMYIEFVDMGFAQTKRYYTAKLPVFEKYAKSCKDTTISHTQLVDMYNRICYDHERLSQPFIYLEEGELQKPFIKVDKNKLQSPFIKLPK